MVLAIAGMAFAAGIMSTTTQEHIGPVAVDGGKKWIAKVGAVADKAAAALKRNGTRERRSAQV